MNGWSHHRPNGKTLAFGPRLWQVCRISSGKIEPLLPVRMGQSCCSLEVQGVDERLGEVTPQLVFFDIPLLGVDLRRPGALTRALEPAGRLEVLSLLVEG